CREIRSRCGRAAERVIDGDVVGRASAARESEVARRAGDFAFGRIGFGNGDGRRRAAARTAATFTAAFQAKSDADIIRADRERVRRTVRELGGVVNRSGRVDRIRARRDPSECSVAIGVGRSRHGLAVSIKGDADSFGVVLAGVLNVIAIAVVENRHADRCRHAAIFKQGYRKFGLVASRNWTAGSGAAKGAASEIGERHGGLLDLGKVWWKMQNGINLARGGASKSNRFLAKSRDLQELSGMSWNVLTSAGPVPSLLSLHPGG